MMPDRELLIAAARSAADGAYAPYSKFAVGAALGFADGRVVTAANVENASFGLSLCAETIAVAQAMSAGVRDGLVAVAVRGSSAVTPCGRCRQVLAELALLGHTDPLVWCSGAGGDVLEWRLSALLPDAFGPANLA